MTSSVSRSDSNRFLSVRILESQSVIIPSVQFIRIERCDPPSAAMYTDGHSTLCRCWTCDTLGMCHPLWWWICGTHDAVLDESRSFFRVHTGYFSNIPKCIKAEFIASWECSQSSVVSSSQR
ncbi:hypothetical protein TNCV_428821 [Trichonephila clavipes]|nr:hypothetical protein TNCV_428821 [Trichonephila clavipes]